MDMVMEEVMRAAGNDMAVLVKTNMRDGFKGGMEIEDVYKRQDLCWFIFILFSIRIAKIIIIPLKALYVLFC